MTRHDDLIRLLEGYLEEYEDSTPLPESVRDAVRAQIPSTMQRPAWWPERRFPSMSNYVRIGLAAAVVAVAAALGYNYLIAPNVGGPGIDEQTRTPEPTQTPIPLPVQGELAPGTYAIDDVLTSRILLTVPDGWQKNVIPAAVWTPDSNAHLGFATVENVVVDPCAAVPVFRDPAVGPTVDDLVTALESLPGLEVSLSTDVTVAGYAGKRLELTAPDATCGDATLWRIQPLDDNGPLEVHAVVWVLDVDGERLAIIAHDRPGAATSDIEEMQAMVDSLGIER